MAGLIFQSSNLRLEPRWQICQYRGAVWHDEAFAPDLVIKAALKDFEWFPEEAQLVCLEALTIAGEGGKSDIAKPVRGLGSGVFEIALAHRGDAFRVVY